MLDQNHLKYLIPIIFTAINYRKKHLYITNIWPGIVSNAFLGHSIVFVKLCQMSLNRLELMLNDPRLWPSALLIVISGITLDMGSTNQRRRYNVGARMNTVYEFLTLLHRIFDNWPTFTAIHYSVWFKSNLRIRHKMRNLLSWQNAFQCKYRLLLDYLLKLYAYDWMYNILSD